MLGNNLKLVNLDTKIIYDLNKIIGLEGGGARLSNFIIHLNNDDTVFVEALSSVLLENIGFNIRLMVSDTAEFNAMLEQGFTQHQISDYIEASLERRARS